MSQLEAADAGEMEIRDVRPCHILHQLMAVQRDADTFDGRKR